MKRWLAALLAASLLTAAAGCALREDTPEDGRLRVVCTLFPYYDFARQLGGNLVDVSLVVPAGRETHSFEPTPLDVIEISQADVFVYNGGESEQWVEDILAAAGEDIPYRLPMMEQVETAEEEFVEGMEGGHDHGHDHEDHEGHHHDGHQEEIIEYDEHIWTSPVNAMTLCRALCDTLCQADPAHQETYRARLESYLTDLTELDALFRGITASSCRDLLVFGDRFPLLYFCREYGLDYRAAFHGCAGDTEPSLSTLKYLIDLVSREDIPVVYTIELSSRKIAEAICETTGAEVRTFHSCQTVSRDELDSGATYISLMTANAAVLKEGLT